MKTGFGHSVRNIIDSRKALADSMRGDAEKNKSAEEGGCGVVGFAANVPVRGRHILEPSAQMNNRGNGKGGGIACACLNHLQLGVDEDILRDDYILQIALLDPAAENKLEQDFVASNYRIDHKVKTVPVADFREIGLPVRPPDVVRYHVRGKHDDLLRFAEDKGLSGMPMRDLEDEFVYQNSIRFNRCNYAVLGEKRAFVLSHARNLMIFKVVGFAEHVVQYYGLEDLEAQIWIAHQRYPTKGRVWHPAGSHPFIGMNEALVHNGDFANYHGVSEYLSQHNIVPQFLTDTEVSALLFDLLSRTYKYPLEYLIEAIAPTSELDFDRLPEEKQRIYRFIHSMHIHGSPDGPWFFIVAQSNPDEGLYNLVGITDTSMLRPQVFALQEGEVSIGLVASEKQAIDAALRSISAEDSRFRTVADRYWNARGGSHTDGGAFSFTVNQTNGSSTLSCSDKFGKSISAPRGEYRINRDMKPQASKQGSELMQRVEADLRARQSESCFSKIVSDAASWNLDQLRWVVQEIVRLADESDDNREEVISLLTLLNDRRYDTGHMKRSAVLQICREAIDEVFDSISPLASQISGRFKRIDWGSRDAIRAPRAEEQVLVICSRDFPPEGDDCDACFEVKAYQLGWHRFIVYGLKGQRFQGCGFGPQTSDVRIDMYGSSGDYVGSGADGMQIHIHDSGQDQLGQIMKSGSLVIHGSVGQTFLYGAKGGEVYVSGNCAGRPLINAVGSPRVVINGTCLDFLAESFMAGDPHNGGGFAILNGIEFNDDGKICDQDTPYPGSNLFSLASGGAIFVRDPHRKLTVDQLNGGEFAHFTGQDWELILPYLRKNEQLFGISVEDHLLIIDGERRSPEDIYRTVRPMKSAVLARADVPE